MYEQNDAPTAPKQDAIDINDFVFAATGARVRRLTLPDGEHWFPAVDVARHLGYANTRDALRQHVDASLQKRLDEITQGVVPDDTLRKLAAHRLQKAMKMVNLQGLVQLVSACINPECKPFKTWVSEVIVTIQRNGSYSLEPAPVQPAPTGGTAYVMPQEVADAIVRLEERNIRADELLAVAEAEQLDLMRRGNSVQSSMAEALNRIANSLDLIADRLRPTTPAHATHSLTPQELLTRWRSKNLVVTEDIHAVAACLAPALVHGEARFRPEEIANRTGLTLDRVHDCLRMLIKRGCMRQARCAEDGAPVYVLP